MKAQRKVLKKKPTYSPSLDFERGVGYPQQAIAGVDEVGRGCLAGPVVAAAVILPPDLDETLFKEVTDSKLLTEEQREKWGPRIEKEALAFAVAHASVDEIEKLNIYHASHLAMVRAVEALALRPAHVLVDGNAIPKGFQKPLSLDEKPYPATAIIKGDQRSLTIACASILAKVWRDRLMVRMDEIHPGYDLAKNKGYPTPLHIQAIRLKGITPIHRPSFQHVREHVQRSIPLARDLQSPPA